ncbi:MAG: branched-chain amino acid transport system permease protein [archaeon GW2011_AR3]|nr:MAG: branched-chain amino acid transport system permease protein [archaeon GW2011_AR3]MBS3109273.1 branched-chain amino acid ABC transporter permease [Candidatus Woesearchaeota archaeon]
MAYEYFVHEGIILALFVINVMAFNLAFGYTGVIQLGHVALIGFGAYSSALLSKLLGINPWISILFAGIMTCIFGVLMSIPALRLKKDYLSLVMLGLNFILYAVARNWISLTRGALGLPGLSRLVKDNNLTLIIAIALVALTYISIKILTNSRIGKIMQGIRDDELSVSVLGKNPAIYKAISLGISGFFAGIAGAFYVHYITFLDPSIFELGYLILLLSALNLGGLGHLEGSILGAFIVSFFSVAVRFTGLPADILGPMRDIIYASILIAILVYWPRGLFGKVNLND